jgi:multidrug resistance efflux pump
MSSPFPRTLRSLDARASAAAWLAPGALALLLAAWLVWLFAARLPVYVVSDTARLEAQRAVHAITSPVDGRISRVRAATGDEVAAGSVVFELNAEIDGRRRDEEAAKLGGMLHEVESRRAELASTRQGLAAARRVFALQVQEAAARQESAQTAVALADDDAARRKQLLDAGLVPEIDLLRSRAEAKRRRSDLTEQTLTRQRLQEEWDREEGDRRAAERRVEDEIARLEGEAAAQRAVLARLAVETAALRITAPVGGRIGELARLGAGAWVRAGEHLGAVIPHDRLQVVGGFSPTAALGRLRPGQRAEVRLDGFPPGEYGRLAARVLDVSGEVRDGRLWVDLALDPAAGSRIPLQHGLEGSVAVEIERLSPAALLLRLLGRPAAAAPAGPP